MKKTWQANRGNMKQMPKTAQNFKKKGTKTSSGIFKFDCIVREKKICLACSKEMSLE
jgi:hypothetical protein